jgi:hypothetical protein
MPWDRWGLRKECDLAISVEVHAARGDRFDLESALDELRRRSGQRIGGRKSAAYRRLFVEMTGHPEMDALLSAFDSWRETVLREDVDHWLAHGGVQYELSLWELSGAAAALKAALVLEGEAAAPAGPARSGVGTVADFRHEAWWKRLSELRPRFESRAFDDLNYVRLDLSVTREEDKTRLADVEAVREAIPIEEATVPDGAAVLFDEFIWLPFEHDLPLAGGEADLLIQRHILFGTADAASLTDFKAWAKDAGRCIAMRPTSKDKTGGGLYHWLGYVFATAAQKIPGCRLHADEGVTTAFHPPTDGAGSYFSML